MPACTRDPDAIFSRGRRHLFIVPWRHYTLVGVWHVVHRGSPDEFRVTDAELRSFLEEVRAGYPALDATVEEIPLWNAGLVLFGENRPGALNLSYGKRSRIIDHARAHGIQGLLTLIGVRWTTARAVADQVARLVLRRLARRVPPCTTAVTPMHGGDIGHFREFLDQALARHRERLAPSTIRHLARNYGTAYERVLTYADGDPALRSTLDGSPVLKAEIVHAVREEMAQRLTDVVLRRTDLGTGDFPGDAALTQCGAIMARELGWSPERTAQEIDVVQRAYRHAPRPAPSQPVLSS